jgi:signal peptidase I
MSETESTSFTQENFAEPKETFREFISFFRDLVVILIIVIFIRIFIVTPFRINGSSMEESYHDKEYILVDKFSYLNFPQTFGEMIGSNWIDSTISTVAKNIPIHIGDPDRGDVVVITPHVDRSREYYIKRVVGLPGDTIRISGGKVFIKKS